MPTSQAATAADAIPSAKPALVPGDRFVATAASSFDAPELRAFFENTVLGAAPSAFQDLAFLKSMFGTIGKDAGAEPVLVGVSRDGKPFMLLAFARRRRRGATVIESVDFGVSDCFAPIAGPAGAITAEEAGKVWTAIKAALPRADAILLKKVPEDLYGRPNPLWSLPKLKPMATATSTFELTTHQALAAMSVVKDAKRRMRRVAKEDELTFACAATPEQASAMLDDILVQRRTRFGALKRKDIFDNPAYEAFYRRLAEDGTAGGEGRVFVLSARGEAIAGGYGLSHNGVFSLLISTMTSDPAWFVGSPGLGCMVRIMDWAIDTGHHTFDFSVGTLHYKSRFGCIKHELGELQEALTPIGLPVVAEEALRRRLRRFGATNPKADAWLREKFHRFLG
jgi:CelD/BcsL family acetyltransferase involved in cellulose biosynthesis